ncbi:MAG: hypothetical protein AB7G15_03180 [Alphaproteobacteria bacterium]
MSKSTALIAGLLLAASIGSTEAARPQSNLLDGGPPPTPLPGAQTQTNIQLAGWGDAFRAWVNGCRYGDRWVDEHWVQMEIIGPGGRYRSGAVLVDGGCVPAI